MSETYKSPYGMQLLTITTGACTGHCPKSVKSDSQHYTLDNNRTVKKAFNTKPIGIRKIGRPKLTWEDDVIKDIKTSE
jgi:hypothetical protein